LTFVTPSWDVGYSANKVLTGEGARKHAVQKDPETGQWTTRCTGAASTREYRGFAGTITCHECKTIILKEKNRAPV
jgi:hypothetical protein